MPLIIEIFFSFLPVEPITVIVDVSPHNMRHLSAFVFDGAVDFDLETNGELGERA